MKLWTEQQDGSPSGTVSEAVDSLMEKIQTFLTHVFVKREQSSCFEEKLSNIPDGNAVIQVDFSENYSFQQEGRSSLHTGVKNS